MVGIKGSGLVVAAVAAASAHVVDLPIIIDNSYTHVAMQIGTPPKTYRLHFDTGSATTWVVGNECVNSTENCPNSSSYKRVGYNPATSSSSYDKGPYSFIDYLGGGVGGEAYEDAFTTPSTVSSAVTWNQTFLNARMSSWRWISADGFLGLAFSSIAQPGTTTLVETMMQAGLLDQPRFSVFYGTNLSDTAGRQADGVFTIGGSKEDTYVDGEVSWVPLRQEYPYEVWRAALRSITVSVQGKANSTLAVRQTQPAGKVEKTLNVTDGRAVFDTGAGTVSVPDDLIEDIWGALGFNYTGLLDGTESFGCKDLNSSWSLSFTLGENDPANDVTLSIAGDEFALPGDQCMPPINPSGGNGFALLGAAFLRRFYSVWDFGANEVMNYEPRLGFGKLKQEYDWLHQ